MEGIVEVRPDLQVFQPGPLKCPTDNPMWSAGGRKTILELLTASICYSAHPFNFSILYFYLCFITTHTMHKQTYMYDTDIICTHICIHKHTNSEASANNLFWGACAQKFGDQHLDQGSANCDLQTTVFVVLLVHSHVHSFTCGLQSDNICYLALYGKSWPFLG